MGASLQWSAQGIEHALACGGVVLERYFRPGFTGGPAVRKIGEAGVHVEGFVVSHDLDLEEDEDRHRNMRESR